MQIQRTQGYNKNFNGLLKFNNITINPNHITKSKVYTSFHEMKVNRQNPYHGHYNTYLQERDVHLKGKYYNVRGKGFVCLLSFRGN